jgi:hypothetical protein
VSTEAFEHIGTSKKPYILLRSGYVTPYKAWFFVCA